MNLTEHHKYWQSIANQPYQQERLKTMNPLQAIAPLLNQINTLKNENTQPESQTQSLVYLNAKLLEALKQIERLSNCQADDFQSLSLCMGEVKSIALNAMSKTESWPEFDIKGEPEIDMAAVEAAYVQSLRENRMNYKKTYVVMQYNEFIFINDKGEWDTTTKEDLAMLFSESEADCLCHFHESLKRREV